MSRQQGVGTRQSGRTQEMKKDFPCLSEEGYSMDADRSGRVREPAKSFNLAEFKEQAEEAKARIHKMQGLILGLLAGEE